MHKPTTACPLSCRVIFIILLYFVSILYACIVSIVMACPLKLRCYLRPNIKSLLNGTAFCKLRVLLLQQKSIRAAITITFI